MRPSARRPLAVLLALGWACAERPAHAQAAVAPTPAVEVTGECPGASMVARIVETLFPAPSGAGTTAGPTIPATVTDLGDAYRVTVGDRSKTYTDTRRDCRERARVSAAFIALALFPDSAVEAPPPAPPPPVEAPKLAPPVPVPPRATPHDAWVRVGLHGAASLALPPVQSVAVGVEAEVSAGWRLLGADAVCGWSAPTPLSLPDQRGEVLIERFPCAVGPVLRLADATSRFGLDVGLGLALGALRAMGRGFATDDEATRFEWGARLAVDGSIRLGPSSTPLASVVGLETTYVADRYALDVDPRGTVARTPSLWIAATIGLRWLSH